jgi:uncharacterized membrane protein
MWRSLALGVVTGLRSQLPTAAIAWRAARHELPEGVAGPAGVLRRRGTAPALALAAAGELVADKLPATPSRLDTGPFLGRLSLGATAGAAIATAFGGSRLLGGALGIAGAALGAQAGARYRAAATAHTDVPDVVWALLEDVVAITIVLAATRRDA